MSGPVRVGLRHVVRELRGGFVLRPGAITLALAALAIGLTAAEERITTVQAWSDFLDRIFPPEPEAAHVVLGTIAGSMITVVSVVYSILLVVLTFASSQFSPRVLVAFVEDRVSQTTLGRLRRHVHLLPADPAGGPEPAQTVRPLDRGGRRDRAGDRLPGLPPVLHPPHGLVDPGQPHRGPDRPRDRARRRRGLPPPPRRAAGDRGPRPDPARRAGAGDAVGLHPLLRRGGPTGGRGRPTPRCASIAISGSSSWRALDSSRSRPRIGRPRPCKRPACTPSTSARCGTMERDVEFGVLQIVDIALKAISPAVNDPTTALTCIDQLGRILVPRRCASRPCPPCATTTAASGS